jgi:predicted RecA/RadA family phage recombinase
MKNHVQEGRTLPFIAPSDLAPGDGVLLSATLFGVNVYQVANGSTGEAVIEEVFALPKAAITNTRFAAAYWDNTNKVTTNVASGNVLIGFYTEAAGPSVATPVRLIPKAA